MAVGIIQLPVCKDELGGGGGISSTVVIDIPFLGRQASISCLFFIMSRCAQANLLLGSFTSTQPPIVCFPVTGSGSLKASIILFWKGAGSERKLPFTKTKQSLLSGDALGLGLGSLSDFVVVGDGFGEEFGDDDTLSAGAVGGTTGVRVEIPIAKTTVAKAPMIPTGRRNLTGKVETAGELVGVPTKIDDKFAVGVGFDGSTEGIRVCSGSTVLGVEGVEFHSLSLPDFASSSALSSDTGVGFVGCTGISEL